MSVFEQLGPLALASRLKQLSESLSKDVGLVYQKMDIPFEPRWFTFFWALKQSHTLTITELANELRQTHAAVVQVANQLEKKGLLVSSKDKNDERRRKLQLSAKGLKLFEEVEPVLNAIEQANRELIQLTAPDLLQNLRAMEQALEQKSMYESILDKLDFIKQGIVLKTYSSSYQEHFFRLNKEWMEGCFGELTEKERQILLYPEENVIEKGGMIYFALYHKQVIGTAAIHEKEKGIYQLSMFAVTKEFRGKGIGKTLYERTKGFALSKKASGLCLFTSLYLPATINFFIKQGFYFASKSEQELTNINRPTIKMEQGLRH